jgi:hypothetical protein
MGLKQRLNRPDILLSSQKNKVENNAFNRPNVLLPSQKVKFKTSPSRTRCTPAITEQIGLKTSLTDTMYRVEKKHRAGKTLDETKFLKAARRYSMSPIFTAACIVIVTLFQVTVTNPDPVGYVICRIRNVIFKNPFPVQDIVLST